MNEFYQVLKNYEKINSIEDLVKIFPEVNQFNLHSPPDILFLLGRVSVETAALPQGQLFGINLLFDAIRDPNRSTSIKENYGFDYRELVRLTSEFDPFSREEVFGLNQLVSELDAKLSVLDKVISERDTHIHNLSKTVSERDTHINNLSKTISECNVQIVALNQTIVESNAQVDILRQMILERDHEIHVIRQSNSWKITAPFRMVGDFIKGRIYGG